VTFLDGEIMRKNISSELGFSHEHRDINIQRQAYIENLITRHGGIAICAPIAPYANTRAQVRVIVEEDGDFIEIYVATPLAVCESYDRKGLCARAGLIRQFTGVSDPYETPINPEIVVDTSRQSANEAADKILAYLAVQGFLSRHGKSPVALVKPERDPSLLWQNDSSGALPMTKSTPLIRYGQQVPKSRFSSNRKFFNRAVKWCEGGFIFLPARLSSLPAETAGRPRDDRPARGCRHARR
ncbi:MAG TPA: adenylyl-sulfate kinase, partial [Sulfuricaulis sp.]